MYACIHVYNYVYNYVCLCVCVCMYMYMYVCMYVSVCKRLHVMYKFIVEQVGNGHIE